MKYKKEIPVERVDTVRTLFYKCEASKKLLDNASEKSNDLNEEAANIILDSYVRNYSAWKKEMDKVEYEVLGDYYRSFPYEYVIEFTTDHMVLSVEDENPNLLLLGFVQL